MYKTWLPKKYKFLLTFKDCCFLSIIDLITLEMFATKICPFLASNFDSLLYFYKQK